MILPLKLLLTSKLLHFLVALQLARGKNLLSFLTLLLLSFNLLQSLTPFLEIPLRLTSFYVLKSMILPMPSSPPGYITATVAWLVSQSLMLCSIHPICRFQKNLPVPVLSSHSPALESTLVTLYSLLFSSTYLPSRWLCLLNVFFSPMPFHLPKTPHLPISVGLIPSLMLFLSIILKTSFCSDYKLPISLYHI